MTAINVTQQLLAVLLNTVHEMNAVGKIEVDNRALLVGMARTLALMLGELAPAAQKTLLPEILHTIISEVPGGKLLVVNSDKPTEH